ncbi:TPR domain-containing protein [Colletotrichum kahawae]|uniref:TPR domain-containing protein n=1 Tax=Colletotrichum kahawae TaxID=34407 RepID=A0AAD9XXW4_COLKA|nr:TPR domain-containing protein [Colletotrichum kahawae]
MESIDDVVDRTRQALEGVPDDDEDRWMKLAEFGGRLDWAWNQTKSMQYLEEAIGVSETVVKITAQKGLVANQADFLATLDALWLDKYRETQDITDLDKAIQVAKQAAELTPEDDEYKAGRLSELSHRIHTKYKLFGRLSDLQEAIQAARQAIEASLGIHNEATRAGWQSDLAFLVTARFRHTGESKDLEDGVRYAREAVEATPADHRERSNRLNNLGHVFYSKYVYTDMRECLEEAIDLAKDAIDTFTATLPLDHPSGLDRRYNLAVRLRARYSLTASEEDINEATRISQEVLSLTPQGSLVLPTRLNLLGSLLEDRYKSTLEKKHLDEAIEIAMKGVDATSNGSLDRAMFLRNLAFRFGEKFLFSNSLDDLDLAIHAARKALEIIPRDVPERLSVLSNLGALLGKRYSQTLDAGELDEAIGFAREAHDAFAGQHIRIRDKISRIIVLHDLLDKKYSRTGAISDLETVIFAAKEAVNITPKGHEQRPELLDTLSHHLDHKYFYTRATDDLHECIRFTREALAAASESNPHWAARCHNLGLRLGENYSAIGKRAASDLAEAILMSRKAVKATHEEHPMRPDYLNGLSLNLGRQYYENGRWADLDEAIKYAKEVMKVAPSNHPDRGYFLINLSNRVGDRFTHTGDEDDLTEATQLAQEALEATTQHGPRLSIRMNNLGLRLRDRYLRTGETKDLDRSVELARKATEATSTGTRTPERTDQQFNLAIRLGDRYQRTGEEADLREAIELAKEAVQFTPEGHPAQGTRLNALASLLGDKYARSHVLSYLDDSVAFARKATLVGAHEHFARRAEYLNNLGNRLSDRYSHSGALNDLEEAIKFHDEAVKTVPPTHPDRADYLNNLGNALSDRYERKGSTADLDRAIIVSQAALEALVPQDNPNRGPILSTIGNRLIDRYSGENHQKRGQIEDLNMAISQINEAVQVTPPGRPDRVKYLSNQGKFYGLKYRHLGMQNLDDLDLGISAAKQAVNICPEDHPDRAAATFNLGRLLGDRYSQVGEPDDLRNARENFALTLGHKQGPISLRIDAGRQFLLTPDVLNDSQQAYDIAKQTISLVPVSAPLSLRPADKQYFLTQAVGLASDSAAIAIEAGKSPTEALTLLETGRGIIAGSLQKIRADTSELHRSHPKLAQAFDQLRNLMDSSDASHSDPNKSSIEADTRHLATARMENLLTKIQQQPGFEGFLGTMSDNQMLQAGSRGPVIVVNVSRFRCDAIIVEECGIRALPLYDVTYETIESKASEVRYPYTLIWLWDVIVGPVLESLGFLSTPHTGNSWPHVWWIPTGPLVGFPLHAAGHHFGGQERTALDRVISSYSTSVQAIVPARKSMNHSSVKQNDTAEAAQEQSEGDSGPEFVLVSMPTTPDMRSLKHAASEIDAVKEGCKSRGIGYMQAAGKHKNVLAALSSGCKVFHFAGHGDTHSIDPLQSRLLLEDWQSQSLTAGSLLEINLKEKAPFLAYLSACGTSQILDDRSVDESIHLAGAFQLAGFRHVIGTLWEVDDGLCVDTAKLTYEGLWEEGMTDDSVCRSLSSHDSASSR